MDELLDAVISVVRDWPPRMVLGRETQEEARARFAAALNAVIDERVRAACEKVNAQATKPGEPSNG